MLENGLALVLTIGYFVVFQYMNKGKTFGKMALAIQVVDANTEKPTSIIKGLIRSLIILGILSSCLELIFINFLAKDSYMTGYLAIGAIELIFIIVSVIFILYRQDGRGLHDLMANTKVIREGK